MAGTVTPIPADRPQVMPYLAVDGAAAAIAFYEKVFGAKEQARMSGPGGRIGHAEIAIGRGVVMLADASPQVGMAPPVPGALSTVSLMVYVEDSDAVVALAVENGATLTREVADQFYGDRAGEFLDPFGHRWFVASHVEDVSDEEMATRAAALSGG